MRVITVVSVLALAACSSGGSGNSGGGSGGSSSASNVNTADACAALSREAVAEAIGMPVQSSGLEGVTADDGNGMAGSTCVFDFGEARLLQLSVQRYPNGIEVASVQQQSRTMFSEEGKATLEDVPGLGADAFYAPKATTMVIEIDDNRQMLFTLNRLRDLPDAKAKLTTLARKVLG